MGLSQARRNSGQIFEQTFSISLPVLFDDRCCALRVVVSPVDALDNGSVTAASSSSVEKDVVLVDNNNSNSDGQCTATVSDLPLSPTLTALPLLQPATTVSDVTAAQESRDQKPRDMTLSAVEPTAAADDEVPVAEEPPSLTLRTSGVEGSSTLTLLGELLPHQQQHEHSVPSGSLSVMSASHVAMDVDDRDRTDGIQSSVRPRYGVVVNSLPGPSARPRSRSPATCLVDDRRFFSPLIVHRAVACPYPIPFGVVGAHPAAGCFFEPQRCWWQPPPQATSSSTSLQTSLSELCSSDGTASAALQRLFCDVNAAQMTSSSADRKLEARTLPASAVTSTTASSRRSSRRDRVSPGPVTAKSFTCPAPDCGRSFSRSDELARHGRVHSGERPFSCTVCGRAFSRRDHLATHVRTHTGEKPYSCEVCARSFARSDERNRHRRVHGKASTAEPRNTAPPARHLEQTCTGL